MSLIRHFFPNNEAFSYEVLRAAGYSASGGGDLAEIINICARVRSGDELAWVREWQQAAERAEGQAATSLSVGNAVSAINGYLCASNYYRTAEFFRRDNPFEDDLSKTLYQRSADTFYKAMGLSSVHCEQVKIPYEGTHLPGYIVFPPGDRKNLKIIVFNGGYDSTKEEAWFALAASAVQRGYAVLAFDGPGQGAALREQRLYFRPDWEAVLTPVIDYTLSRPEVDPNAVIVFGWSMGGYLVARAATVEHRAAALVLDDGVYDFGAAFVAQLPGPVAALIHTSKWDYLFDPIIRLKTTMSTGERWGILNGLWTFGLQSPSAFLRAIAQYTLEGRCDRIKTRCLILDARDDHFLKGQPQALAKHLTVEHELITLGGVDGGETHCHQGAFQRLHQIVFDWLAKQSFSGQGNSRGRQTASRV